MIPKDDLEARRKRFAKAAEFMASFGDGDEEFGCYRYSELLQLVAKRIEVELKRLGIEKKGRYQFACRNRKNSK